MFETYYNILGEVDNILTLNTRKNKEIVDSFKRFNVNKKEKCAHF